MLLETISVTLCTAAAGYVAIKLFCPWLLGDLNYLAKFIPALIKYVKLEKNNTTLADVFEARAAAKPDNIFILYEGRKYTYKVFIYLCIIYIYLMLCRSTGNNSMYYTGLMYQYDEIEIKTFR